MDRRLSSAEQAYVWLENNILPHGTIRVAKAEEVSYTFGSDVRPAQSVVWTVEIRQPRWRFKIKSTGSTAEQALDRALTAFGEHLLRLSREAGVDPAEAERLARAGRNAKAHARQARLNHLADEFGI